MSKWKINWKSTATAAALSVVGSRQQKAAKSAKSCEVDALYVKGSYVNSFRKPFQFSYGRTLDFYLHVSCIELASAILFNTKI